MKKIIDANQLVLKILKKPNLSAPTYRLIRFCLTTKVDDGLLLFNTLTKELIHLTEEEYANASELPYLKERWFSVPTDTNEEELVELLRLVLSMTDNPKKHKTHYTIFTTTDCNARCFYCYEHGCKKVTMSEETAHKTAQFIKDNCGGEKISICWYGGEPLLNTKVIDIICDDLRALGVPFTSFIITN